MPKLKTNKAAKKRYSLTATGKVKRTKSNRRHLLANKTKRQKKSGKIQRKRKKSVDLSAKFPEFMVQYEH